MVIACVALLILAGVGVREVLGLELSPESIRQQVLALGWLAPVVYVLMLAFRQFLALPSAIILPAGGALFGILGGTVLGGCGVLASGALCFSLGRGLARSRKRSAAEESPTEPDLSDPGRARRGSAEIVRAAGPMFIALITAHPTGPMTAAHSTAGMSPLPWSSFLLAVALGALVRSFVLSYFGASLLRVGSLQFWVATLLVLAVAVVPFLYAPLRQQMFRRSVEG